jgi:hypothetical protein
MVFNEPSYEISRRSKKRSQVRRLQVRKFCSQVPGSQVQGRKSNVWDSRLEGKAEDIGIPMELYSSALPESKLFVLFDPLGRKRFASLAGNITREVHFISGHRARVFDLERHSAIF